ncbi:MAG: hypothetical protein ABWX94_01935 [Candidatus Saccharimonadales bacterium]
MSSTDLVLSVEPMAGSDEWHTNRNGFSVHAHDVGGLVIGSLDAFEGYSLGERNGEETVVEYDTFHLQYVQSMARPGEGIATALIERAIAEGQDRGLSRGRAEIGNPRIVTILDKLQDQGLISRLEFFGGAALLQSVERLQETGQSVTTTEAKDQLNAVTSADRFGGASPKIKIRTLFAL